MPERIRSPTAPQVNGINDLLNVSIPNMFLFSPSPIIYSASIERVVRFCIITAVH